MKWLKNRLADVLVITGALYVCSAMFISINFDVYLKLLDLFWWLQD